LCKKETPETSPTTQPKSDTVVTADQSPGAMGRLTTFSKYAVHPAEWHNTYTDQLINIWFSNKGKHVLQQTFCEKHFELHPIHFSATHWRNSLVMQYTVSSADKGWSCYHGSRL
jgi:hypothetical protein